MTAKQKLSQVVEGLSENEAADALGYLTRSRRNDQHDELIQVLDNAPIDDEPTTSAEGMGVREAREEIARGEVISADDIRREFA